MTWWNWLRISPLAAMPAGQWTMVPLRVPPKCDATCLVHWIRRVHRVRPTHRVVVVGLDAAELVDALRQELRRLEVTEPAAG